MPLVSGLTARESFGKTTLGLEVSRTQDAAFMGEIEYRFFCGSAQSLRQTSHLRESNNKKALCVTSNENLPQSEKPNRLHPPIVPYKVLASSLSSKRLVD